jgi:hypothetical protein
VELIINNMISRPLLATTLPPTAMTTKNNYKNSPSFALWDMISTWVQSASVILYMTTSSGMQIL